MFTLMQVLSHGERIIVFSDETSDIIITWNQSLTLQAWESTSLIGWEEIDIRTLSDVPADYFAARASAVEWYLSGDTRNA